MELVQGKVERVVDHSNPNNPGASYGTLDIEGNYLLRRTVFDWYVFGVPSTKPQEVALDV